jgi:uncharacterized glyoxalase superfamily protein PhnB
MVNKPPHGYTRIAPYLLYEDPAAALEWLARAFGFRERFATSSRRGGSTTPRWSSRAV